MTRRPLSKSARDARKPLPPEVLADARQETVHVESGKWRVPRSTKVRTARPAFVDFVLDGGLDRARADVAADHARRDALAAARAAVVKAAMAMRSTMCPAMETAGDHYMVIDRNGPEWQAYNAACADLKKLGG